MTKKITKNPLFYLAIITIGYSIYDYFDHILRPGSSFGDHPWHWLAFSIAAVASLFIALLLFKGLLEKAFKTKNLLFEVIAMGIWLFLYINFLGPLINKTFWPFSDLSFKFKFGPFFILLGIYFAVRIIMNLIMGKKLLDSD